MKKFLMLGLFGLYFLSACTSFKTMRVPGTDQTAQYVVLGALEGGAFQSNVKVFMLKDKVYKFGITSVRLKSTSAVPHLEVLVDGKKKLTFSCQSGKSNHVMKGYHAMYSLCEIPDSDREILKGAKSIEYTVTDKAKKVSSSKATEEQVAQVRKIFN